MVKRSPLKWELIGIAVISLLGSALHFAFEWSGETASVGVFAAVNESVFEHLKLTFWPTVLYAAGTYALLQDSVNNFIIAKTAAVYAMPVTIIVLFYAYTAATGTEILLVDIAIFIVAVAVGQVASYRILVMKKLPAWLTWASFALTIALAAIYGLFTFYPPRVPFFADPNTGAYGIP
jgi:hypothetical protein